MAGTANITPSDGPPAGSAGGNVQKWVKAEQDRRQARRMAVPAVILGLGLLAMAVPRFAGELMVWPARTGIINIQTGQETDGADELAAAIAAIGGKGDWTGDSRLVADGGLLLMHQAAMTTDPVARLDLLQQAVTLTEKGLRRGPAHPVAWTRLAALRTALGQPDKAAAAFRLSLLSGPLVPQITASRLAQGLSLLPYLDQDTQGLLARQVRLLQAARPEQLAALKTDAAARDFIQRSLSGGLVR